MPGARFLARYSVVIKTEPAPACIRASILVGKTDSKQINAYIKNILYI